METGISPEVISLWCLPTCLGSTPKKMDALFQISAKKTAYSCFETSLSTGKGIEIGIRMFGHLFWPVAFRNMS